MAKILLADIQHEAEELQWEVLSSEYINLKTEMRWRCSAGHEVITSYEKWRRSHTCPICQLKEKETQVVNCITPKSVNDYRILALDQATKTSGWAIFQNGELIRHGMYTVDGTEVSRINDVKNWVWNMISVWKIDYVQLEDIQLQDHKEQGGNGEKIGITTYKALAHLQGVLENLLYSNNIHYSIVHSSTWRNYNKIKGKNKTDRKKSAQLIVQDKYNIYVPLDEAEAICIGLYAVHNHSKQEEMLIWE